MPIPNVDVPIIWNDLEKLRDKMVCCFVEFTDIHQLAGPFCGQISRVIQTPTELRFVTDWSREWDYEQGGGCWGSKKPKPYEHIISRSDVISIGIRPNLDLRIVYKKPDSSFDQYYLFRIGNMVGMHVHMAVQQ